MDKDNRGHNERYKIMAVIRLDLANMLVRYINNLSPFAHCKIGLLDEGNALSVIQTPGGNETSFFDGSRLKEVQMNVMAKHIKPEVAPEFLSYLFQELELLQALPSENGSYEFYGVTITSLPSLVAIDNQDYAIYQCSISVQILIHKGVGL